MQFVSMREFTTSPRETQAKLAASSALIVTNNGNPSMLVIDITNRDFLRTIDYIRRMEALDILHDIQMASVRKGTDGLSMEDIDSEIAIYRSEKRSDV